MLQFQRQDPILHAYIASSPSAENRERLSTELAAAMLCEGGGARPCGQCRSCRKVFHGVHPDILITDPEGGAKTAAIKVDQIRQIVATAHIMPSEGACKVYVLRQADKMNLSAQNALLKLLEEPPRSAAFILAAENPGALLPTVRSRCELLRDSAAGEAPPDEALAYAAEYFQAVCAPQRSALLRWCAAHERDDTQTVQAFLQAARQLLSQKISGRPDLPQLSDAEAARQLERLELCERYLRANVGIRHIYGLLSVPTAPERDGKN